MQTTFRDGRYFDNLICLVTVRKWVIMTSKIRFCMIRKEIYFYKTASSLLFSTKSLGQHAHARTVFAPKLLLSEQ